MATSKQKKKNRPRYSGRATIPLSPFTNQPITPSRNRRTRTQPTQPVRSRRNRLVKKAIALMTFLIVGNWIFGNAIGRRFALSDLRQHAATIRSSGIKVESKIRLLNLIDALQWQVREGNNAANWNERDDAIRDILSNEIGNDEVRLIMRELEQAQRQLNER